MACHATALAHLRCKRVSQCCTDFSNPLKDLFYHMPSTSFSPGVVGTPDLVKAFAASRGLIFSGMKTSRCTYVASIAYPLDSSVLELKICSTSETDCFRVPVRAWYHIFVSGSYTASKNLSSLSSQGPYSRHLQFAHLGTMHGWGIHL